MKSDNNILTVKHLSTTLENKKVLSSVNFNLVEGEFVALIGPSGVGKTVLLRTITGLNPNYKGEIILGNSNCVHPAISIAFQKSSLFPWLDIYENIKICMGNKFSKLEKDKIVTEYLRIAHLEKYCHYHPSQISVGMSQKVNILRCFCVDSQIIFMDEPFVSLDFIQRKQLQNFTIDIWRKKRKTILFVTHDIHEAIYLSNRILLLSGITGHLTKEYKINFPYPRNHLELQENAEYQKLYREIYEDLQAEVNYIQKRENSSLNEKYRPKIC